MKEVNINGKYDKKYIEIRGNPIALNVVSAVTASKNWIKFSRLKYSGIVCIHLHGTIVLARPYIRGKQCRPLRKLGVVSRKDSHYSSAIRHNFQCHIWRLDAMSPSNLLEARHTVQGRTSKN
ncbi:hypothetical protein CEXT_93411 [Caerostris extrusa]|uniref:Uncharacterized protein n=1 Tax=Caerostris extrusa TaxID=172846 RepID=A0AAV4U239_CAEEX|nr:hypothetical protein CEXT_93411 [Caerostris extrusa]